LKEYNLKKIETGESLKKEIGTVIKLFISQSHEPKRKNMMKLVLDEKGIEHDKFYDKDLTRSVLLSSTHSYTMAEEENISIEYGLLGENILIDYNVYTLPVDAVIEIGEVAFQITQNCTICNHLSSIDKRLPKLLRNDRGVFVKVIESGTIHEGDKVSLLSS